MGKVSSFQSLGTLDGPGVRFVVFLQGCPLRCQYCHNPDSWEYNTDNLKTVEEILAQYNGVKEFCPLIIGFESDMDLSIDRYTVDAKSLLGVLSLSVDRPA